jgi:N-acetylglucosamine-6-phosphate deacetylase
MSAFAVAASHVFDGDALLPDHAVIVEDATIAAVLPRAQLPDTVALQRLEDGLWLTPGFIDVQVNGGGDVLFNDEPTEDAIVRIATAHRSYGTTSLLPTLISDSADKMRAAVAAVAQARTSVPAVLGIHFEGPFLCSERRGVHDAAQIRAAAQSDVDLLTALRDGVTLVTLAPEEAPPGFIAALAAKGARVALGHSMATYEQTRQAMAEGLTGFTHLFNAMRPMTSREPGPIAAALENPSAFYGLIVDGEHVAPAMLRLALRGRGTAFLITDAMPPVGGSGRSFQLHGETIFVEHGRLATADGTLAGAALDMATAVRNAVQLLDIELTEALRLATRAPACFLRLENSIGALKTGCRADFLALEPNSVRVREVWCAGERSRAKE